jgi:hypothetical protein
MEPGFDLWAGGRVFDIEDAVIGSPTSPRSREIAVIGKATPLKRRGTEGAEEGKKLPPSGPVWIRQNAKNGVFSFIKQHLLVIKQCRH